MISYIYALNADYESPKPGCMRLKLLLFYFWVLKENDIRVSSLQLLPKSAIALAETSPEVH